MPTIALLAGILSLTLAGCETGGTGSAGVGTVAGAAAGAGAGRALFGNNTTGMLIGGVFWGHWGWPGVIAFLLAMLTTAVAMVLAATVTGDSATTRG